MAFGASPFGEGAFGGATMVTAAGAIDAARADGFKAVLLTGVEIAGTTVIVDMGETETIGASGLRALMIAHRAARDAGKVLAVAAPAPLIREIFAISRTDRVFAVYGSVHEALAATAPAGVGASEPSLIETRA